MWWHWNKLCDEKPERNCWCWVAHTDSFGTVRLGISRWINGCFAQVGVTHWIEIGEPQLPEED
jgi:hypothetical protein